MKKAQIKTFCLLSIVREKDLKRENLTAALILISSAYSVNQKITGTLGY